MLGMKQIAQYVPVDIDITGITLLSIEEYKATKKEHPSDCRLVVVALTRNRACRGVCSPGRKCL